MFSTVNQDSKFYRIPPKKPRWLLLCKLLFAALPTVVFGVFTVIFTIQQYKAATVTREQDQRQADEVNRRIVFKEYIDNVQALLLDKDYSTKIDVTLLQIRAQTLTVMRHLDDDRKRDVILYLYENHLLRSDENYHVDLRGANLNGIRFSKSAAEECRLPYLYLTGINGNKISFDGCLLREAVFEGASLVEAEFHSCNIADSNFLDTNLTKAKFHGNLIDKTDFSGSYLVQSSIQDGIFRNVRLLNVDLYQSDISDQFLSPSVLNLKSSNIFLNSRYPNGSFTPINRTVLIQHAQAKNRCPANITSLANIQNSIQLHKQDASTGFDHCVFINNSNDSALVETNVGELSVLIDLEQGMVTLSVFVGLNNPNTRDEILMELNFIQGDGLIDDECTSKISIRNASFFQFQPITAAIPAKTRSFNLLLSCAIKSETNQYCLFDQVNLSIFKKDIYNTVEKLY